MSCIFNLNSIIFYFGTDYKTCINVPVDRKSFAQIKLILYWFIVDLRLLLNSVLTRGQTCSVRESTCYYHGKERFCWKEVVVRGRRPSWSNDKEWPRWVGGGLVLWVEEGCKEKTRPQTKYSWELTLILNNLLKVMNWLYFIFYI